MTPLKAGIAAKTMSQARTLMLCYLIHAECEIAEQAQKIRHCAKKLQSYDPNWSKYLRQLSKHADDQFVVRSVKNVLEGLS